MRDDSHRQTEALRPALKAALGYALIAGLWVITSDWLLERLAPERAWLHTVKGVAFVLVTAALLYGTLGYYLHLVRRYERCYRELFEASPQPMWVYDLKNLSFLAVNDAACAHYGYSRGEFLAMTIADIRPPEELPRLRANLAASDGVGFENAGLWRHRKKDGSLITVEITSHGLRFAGRPARLVMARDVTEQQRLAALAERQAQVLEQSPSIVMLTDPEGTIVYVNRRFSEVTGYPPAEVIGRKPSLLKSGELSSAQYAELWRTIRAGGIWRGELPNRKRSGERYWEQATIAPVRDPQGQISHFVKLAEDISDKKALSERLSYLAFHDPLTGLANRAGLFEKLEQLLLGAPGVALALIDVSDFHAINDALGYEAGDALLVELAERLRRFAPLAARLGSDEFAALWPAASPEAAERLLARLLVGLRRPFALAGRPVPLAVSVGLSHYPSDADTPKVLLQHADLALSRAKQRRQRCQRYSAALDAEFKGRIELEHAMRQALKRGEFCLYYQPRVELASGRITSLEALLRWRHPGRGWVPPATFIPLAEQSGLIIELGRLALRLACAQLRRWLAAGLVVPVAVNLSAKELQQPNLLRRVSRTLEEHGIPPSLLELEVTESALMQDRLQASAALRELRELGVRVAIDDFGTAYASLSYLKQLPADTLKIDRAFIAALVEPLRTQDAAIVEAILELGEVFGLSVIAEGVETPFQRDFLLEHGCRLGQGYLFGHPVPPDEMAVQLARGAV